MLPAVAGEAILLVVCVLLSSKSPSDHLGELVHWCWCDSPVLAHRVTQKLHRSCFLGGAWQPCTPCGPSGSRLCGVMLWLCRVLVAHL